MVESDYYVYVYIDPRNFEEFYYGKGKGTRKDAHLKDNSDSEKARRIKEIFKLGLQPIVRVIASGLSEHDALLVEKTLLWKLGRQLTNVASGHYSENFRPHNTIHTLLPGFDYRSGIYYYNIGEGSHRNWDDYKKYGFISGGQGSRWGAAMMSFNEGDVVAAYLKGRGFVGIGKLISRAIPIKELMIDSEPLLSKKLVCGNMGDNSANLDLCEYVAKIDWIKAVDRSAAKWEPGSGLYTTTHVRASLEGQPKTIEFLEKEFGITLGDYLI